MATHSSLLPRDKVMQFLASCQAGGLACVYDADAGTVVCKDGEAVVLRAIEMGEGNPWHVTFTDSDKVTWLAPAAKAPRAKIGPQGAPTVARAYRIDCPVCGLAIGKIDRTPKVLPGNLQAAKRTCPGCKRRFLFSLRWHDDRACEVESRRIPSPSLEEN